MHDVAGVAVAPGNDHISEAALHRKQINNKRTKKAAGKTGAPGGGAATDGVASMGVKRGKGRRQKSTTAKGPQKKRNASKNTISFKPGWSLSQQSQALRNASHKKDKSGGAKPAAPIDTEAVIRKRNEIANAAAEAANTGGYNWPKIGDPSSLAQIWESHLLGRLELELGDALTHGPHAESVEVVGKISLLRFLRGSRHSIMRAAKKFREHLAVRKHFGMDDIRKRIILQR